MEVSSIDTTTLYSGIAAAIVAASLILSQNDKVARYILKPARLRAKRRVEQLYELEKGIAKSILFIRRYINDGDFYDWEEEKKITDFMLATNEIEDLVKHIVTSPPVSSVKEVPTDEKDNIISSTPLIVGIAKDLSLPGADEWFIHLAFPVKVQNRKKEYYSKRILIPLEKFGTCLASAYRNQDEKDDNTTLCFIADASSSLGSNILGQVVQHSQCQIPVIHEPAWMYTIAFLMQKKALSKLTLENILYGLCKLSSQSKENEVGEKCKTVVFTLPGQSCNAALLPLLLRAFPSGRHVFAYDGCVASVQRGISLAGQSNDHYSINDKKKGGITLSSVYPIPETSMPRRVSSSIPLTPLGLKNLPLKIASLSYREASVVEAWMSGVNAFLSLRKDEKNTGYAPFVCRMDYLIGHSHNGNKLESSSTALTNVLEYITGCSSNTSSLGANVIDAAESVLIDLKAETSIQSNREFTHKKKIAVEDCISLHKSILIGDEEFPGIGLPSTRD